MKFLIKNPLRPALYKGPCGGKTSALSHLVDKLTEHDIKVLVVVMTTNNINLILCVSGKLNISCIYLFL
jgi:hypothetical protein